MRTSEKGQVLRGELPFFEATQQEFDAILAQREKMANDPSTPRDYYARRAAECAALAQVLGTERVAEFERTTDLFYIWSRQAAERYGLDEGLAAQAWDVKHEALSAADSIRRNPAWDEEEKRRRLTALKADAERRIEETLGPSAARFAQKGDGAWLQIMAQRAQP